MLSAMASFDRTTTRRARAALARSVRRDAAAAVAGTWRATPWLAGARHVAVYAPIAGELDPVCIVAAARRSGASVHLPAVVADGAGGRTLVFAALDEGAPLEPGVLGIPVPPSTAAVRPIEDLDVVLVPLVAFDAAGTRVGMGAGYYDRAFAPGRHLRRPRLVGLGYAWQEVAHLVREPWDVPLDAVLTERGLSSCAVRPGTR